VGLGTPKQDYASSALAELHGKRTFASVGAAFDFKAGTVVEAPRWIQNSGFEWAYRFLREPRRLWKRYLVGNLVFILAVIKGKKRSEARITA
jgi:N-acetylglucosaminyldiphosphoundecaprenol N-acetyl-beta-D-mannosaminyltransferase